MFCPKCGTRNNEEARFCRGCGEDMALVAQAVNRSPSLVVAHKLEEAWRRNPTLQLAWLKNQRRRAAGELLSGAVTLFVLVWFVLLGKGNPSFAYGVIAAIACYLLALGVWDFLGTPKTSEGSSPEETTNALHDAPAPKGLAAADTSEMLPATSITESTTRHLKEPGRRR